MTPLSKIVRDGNKDGDLDIDSIPIMDLDLSSSRAASSDNVARATNNNSPRKTARRVEIMGDETLGPPSTETDPEREDIVAPKTNTRNKKSLLQVDSAGLAALSLDDSDSGRKMSKLDIERKEAEEAEMARALAAIERSRLEMQRASERVEYAESGAVKKKKKKVRKVAVEGDEAPGAMRPGAVEGIVEGEGEAQPLKKKKKKKVKPEDGEAPEKQEAAEGTAEGEVKKKKKKKRVVVMDE